jgi:diacylglycerol kinase
MKKLYTYWVVRMSHPIRGIITAVRTDTAVQVELVGGSITLIILYFIFGPFTALGNLLLIFCFFLVLITELQNSAVETALDRIHPERHDDIGKSKDLAAGSVLLAALFGVVCTFFVVSGLI